MKMNRKILIVSYEMTYTGSSKAAYNMANVLNELGYEISVWALNAGPFVNQFKDIGLDVNIINFPKEIDSAIEEKIKQFRFAICITVFCASFAKYASNFTETILYIMEASNIPQLIHDCCLNANDIIHARHVACVSKYARNYIRDQYGISHIVILNNYIDFWRGKQCSQRKENEKVKFMVSGTIEYRKGQDIAEKAFLMLPDNYKNRAEMHFIGSVPNWSFDFYNSLRENQHFNIFFHNVISDRDELYEFYQSMDIFLVPSRDEACSLVALEGAMLGKTVLVTENTGAKYIVDRTCVLETGNELLLCKKMMHFIDHCDSLQEKGRENQKRYFKLANRHRFKREITLFLLRMYIVGMIGRIFTKGK